MTTIIGKTKKYFIPDVNTTELEPREGVVVAEEFDMKDATVKVRFMDGHSAHKFAVVDTDEELKAAFEKFQEYRKRYHEALEKIQPVENDLRAYYATMYPEYINNDLLQKIIEYQDANKRVAEMQAQEAANE